MQRVVGLFRNQSEFEILVQNQETMIKSFLNIRKSATDKNDITICSRASLHHTLAVASRCILHSTVSTIPVNNNAADEVDVYIHDLVLSYVCILACCADSDSSLFEFLYGWGGSEKFSLGDLVSNALAMFPKSTGSLKKYQPSPSNKLGPMEGLYDFLSSRSMRDDLATFSGEDFAGLHTSVKLRNLRELAANAYSLMTNASLFPSFDRGGTSSFFDTFECERLCWEVLISGGDNGACSMLCIKEVRTLWRVTSIRWCSIVF